MNLDRTLVAILVFGIACVGARGAPDLTVLPAEVRGVVLLPDGETPVDGLRVRVWNADTEKVVYRTRTDRDGVFDVPKLDEGNHYVTVGPVRIDMRILTARADILPQPHGVVVVIPKRMPVLPALVPSVVTAVGVPQIMSP